MSWRRLTPDELATADPHDLITIRAAAELLLVTPATVRKWVHDGRIGAAVVQGRQHVLLPQASQAEHDTRQSTRGRPRVNDNPVIMR